jgi:hypothetical protein
LRLRPHQYEADPAPQHCYYHYMYRYRYLNKLDRTQPTFSVIANLSLLMFMIFCYRVPPPYIHIPVLPLSVISI